MGQSGQHLHLRCKKISLFIKICNPPSLLAKPFAFHFIWFTQIEKQEPGQTEARKREWWAGSTSCICYSWADDTGAWTGKSIFEERVAHSPEYEKRQPGSWEYQNYPKYQCRFQLEYRGRNCKSSHYGKLGKKKQLNALGHHFGYPEWKWRMSLFWDVSSLRYSSGKIEFWWGWKVAVKWRNRCAVLKNGS